MSALRVEALSRQFGNLVVLTGVDLTVSPGETVVLVGPNGAGKSTLLRCCAGLLAPTTGRIRVAGEAPAEAARLGGIGASSGDGFVRRLDLRANLLWHARLLGLSRRDARPRIASLADELGFGVVLDTAAERCSAGQRARAALARALLGTADLLLLDEPLRCVDVASRSSIVDAVRRHAAHAGVLWVTHDPTEAGLVGDRAVRIDAGRLRPTALLRAA